MWAEVLEGRARLWHHSVVAMAVVRAGQGGREALEQRRWLLPLGLAVIALVVLANASSAGGFGTRGPALVVTLGVAVYAAAA
jgi:hypothetical protein